MDGVGAWAEGWHAAVYGGRFPSRAIDTKELSDIWDEGYSAGFGYGLDPLNGGSLHANPYQEPSNTTEGND